jgi:uncharacterized protein (DUF433 family)
MNERPAYRDRITTDSHILGGKPVITGTRIPVALILNLLANGADHTEIISDYPDLTEEDIHAAIAYAADQLDRDATALPRSV